MLSMYTNGQPMPNSPQPSFLVHPQTTPPSNGSPASPFKTPVMPMGALPTALIHQTHLPKASTPGVPVMPVGARQIPTSPTTAVSHQTGHLVTTKLGNTTVPTVKHVST